MRNEPLGERQVDFLREVGNIGAGHAATALSELLHGTVRLSLTSVQTCPFADIPALFGGPEAVLAATFMRVYGDAQASMLLAWPPRSMTQLLRTLMFRDTGDRPLSELELSTLAEVGNIVCGSYLNALSGLTGLRLQWTVPSAALDMVGALLDAALTDVAAAGDSALLIDTALTQGALAMNGRFLLIPDASFTARLFQAVGYEQKQ